MCAATAVKPSSGRRSAYPMAPVRRSSRNAHPAICVHEYFHALEGRHICDCKYTDAIGSRSIPVSSESRSRSRKKVNMLGRVCSFDRSRVLSFVRHPQYDRWLLECQRPRSLGRHPVHLKAGIVGVRLRKLWATCRFPDCHSSVPNLRKRTQDLATMELVFWKHLTGQIRKMYPCV